MSWIFHHNSSTELIYVISQGQCGLFVQVDNAYNTLYHSYYIETAINFEHISSTDTFNYFLYQIGRYLFQRAQLPMGQN